MSGPLQNDQQREHEVRKFARSSRRKAKHARWWKDSNDYDYGQLLDPYGLHTLIGHVQPRLSHHRTRK